MKTSPHLDIEQLWPRRESATLARVRVRDAAARPNGTRACLELASEPITRRRIAVLGFASGRHRGCCARRRRPRRERARTDAGNIARSRPWPDRLRRGRWDSPLPPVQAHFRALRRSNQDTRPDLLPLPRCPSARWAVPAGRLRSAQRVAAASSGARRHDRTVDVGAAPPDADGLRDPAQRLERDGRRSRLRSSR
jgi:hypothetical protein